MSYKELTLSRANKSVRLFDYVVDCLSKGYQPDKKYLFNIGYLYRTTAVYGSGKFGLADRFRIKDREEICGPFRLEMMLVYLVRQFTFDQVNHIAKSKNPRNAVELNKDICRGLGIGNSTGLGMAPFIVNHPTLLNNWILARETALKKIREIKFIKKEESDLFINYLKKSILNVKTWNTDSEFQRNKIKNLHSDLNKFIKNWDNGNFKNKDYLFNNIYLWCEEKLGEECLEYIVSMMMEPFSEIVEPLIKKMSSNEDKYFTIPTNRTLKDLKQIIEEKYSDILKIDFEKKENNKNFWFISKNKEEPRIADRFDNIGSDLEQPLAIARDINSLYKKILTFKSGTPISHFLIENNDLRHVVRRVFIIEKFPYSEIQDNTIGSKLMPIDMLRLKLSFFGAVKFDPKSDKWLRICMFQGAPLPEELKNSKDNWVYGSIN